MPAVLTKTNTEGVKPGFMETPLRIYTKQHVSNHFGEQTAYSKHVTVCVSGSLSRPLHSIESVICSNLQYSLHVGIHIYLGIYIFPCAVTWCMMLHCRYEMVRLATRLAHYTSVTPLHGTHLECRARRMCLSGWRR